MSLWPPSPELLAYIAGGLFALGYLTINQVRLRLLVALGTVFYLWYYSVVAEHPLWEAIAMSSLMGAANVTGLAILLFGRTKWSVPRAHRDIYPLFDNLQPGDFRNLVRRAQRLRLPKGTELTRENNDISDLYFVISGVLEVEKRGEVFNLPSGIFVGEVAYMTGRPSSATTRSAADVEVLRWRVADITALATQNARFKLALEAMISRDMAVKVAFAVAPHSASWDHRSQVREMSEANDARISSRA